MTVHAGRCPSRQNMCMGVYKRLCFLLCNFVTAAALFYLAELVEEYTVLTAKVIKGMLVVSGSAFAVFCVRKIFIIGSIKAIKVFTLQVSVERKLTVYCRTRTVLDADGARLQDTSSIMLCLYDQYRKALWPCVHI